MATERRFSIGKIPEDKVFKGQAKVIMDHLAKNPNSTVAEMTKAIGSFEGSRQEPDRVIAFYMTTFKKKGLVKVTEVATAEDTTGEAASADSGEEEEADEDETESNGVPLDEKLPEPERVEFHEELSAAEPSPGGKFDGLKMSEAVKKVLERGGINKPEDIAAYLTENGYTAASKNVQGALTNLVKQGVARKSDLGTYSIR